MASQYKVNPLSRCLYPTSISYTPQDFKRQDEGSDPAWYSQPRFVQHIDEGAIATLKSYYGSVIKPNHSVLDMCSSWVSHLPDNLKPQTMIGVGMNQQELARNGHLTKSFIKDLNTNPSLQEVPSDSVDAVICNVSVDYFIQPVSILKEMHRVLRADGTAHIAFSNRCFPTKAIGKWMGMSDEERRKWVGGYFWDSRGWKDVEEVILKEGKSGFLSHEDPLFIVRARKATEN
ncbi:hypothetical protein BDZ45DRAFT_754101 [Acephala macrosclerotiorum]|nr:hypothetical protein BDZ45DRAFT_754101 [Acephala macrosclerotiorum]